jgi:hypothetical protein
MKRSRLPLLAIFPVTVISGVVAVPFLFGTYPLRWEGHSAIPHVVTGDPTPSASTAPPPVAATDPGDSDETTSPASPDPRVAKPWKQGDPQWGVQLYWEDDRTQSVAHLTRKARTQARYLVGLKANSVALSFPFFTGTPTSDKIAAGAKTPTPARLAAVLTVFQDAGLRVTVRPLMDEKSLGAPPHWRGAIKPADRGAWFAHYRTFMGPYLDVAEQHEVATFTLATEFNSLEGDPRWESLVRSVENRFSGEIGYDANWDNYVKGRIDMPVTTLGVDAYFPVKVPDTAPVQDLVDGWNHWLDKKARGPLPKIVLTEAGIGAMNGAYHKPGDFYVSRALNTAVQANWYTAVCSVVRERKMGGVYWWSVYFDSDPYAAPAQNASRLDFAGRPQTEKAVRSCFGSDYAGPGSAAAS